MRFISGKRNIREQVQREEVQLECDPGRTLLHASFYLWKQAGRFLSPAWLDAQEILRHARSEYEDQDRIDFVRRIGHASKSLLVAS